MLVKVGCMCVLKGMLSNILSIQPPKHLRELSILAIPRRELMVAAGTGGRWATGPDTTHLQSGPGLDRGRVLR